MYFTGGFISFRYIAGRPAVPDLRLLSHKEYIFIRVHSLKKELNLPIHIDNESIVGGRISDLTRALHMLYLIYPERLEIIVIAGLNNIGDSKTAE